MRDRRIDAAAAALRPLAGVEEIQVIGALPEYLVPRLPIQCATRTVLLHWNAVIHIHEQRSLGPGDAEFVMEHLSRVVLRPTYYGPDLAGDPRRISLVDYVGPDGRALHVALKFVLAPYADSRTDEIWVSTGHPLGVSSLRRYLRKGRLEAVVSRE